MTKEIDSKTQKIISDFFFANYGLAITEQIRQGHLGLPIYRCQDESENKRVIKVGVGNEGKREVEDNVFGYQEIREAGATAIVPDPIIIVDSPLGISLILPDLGKDFHSQSTLGEEVTIDNFSRFKTATSKVVNSSLRLGSRLHQSGIIEVKEQLSRWYGPLVEKKFLPRKVLSELDSISEKRLSSDMAAIMILDFTPDNVFVTNGGVKFIDPWRQGQYLGTPIPPLAQFCVLSDEVYHLPGFSNETVRYLPFINEAGELLSLTQDQINAQFHLGRALQLSLSAYVRMSSNPDLANQFAVESHRSLRQI